MRRDKDNAKKNVTIHPVIQKESSQISGKGLRIFGFRTVFLIANKIPTD
jgi:hypothetical protein